VHTCLNPVLGKIGISNVGSQLNLTFSSLGAEEILDVPVGLSPRAFEILQGLPRSLNGLVFPISANALKSAFCKSAPNFAP
jgi:hypothetical protein